MESLGKTLERSGCLVGSLGGFQGEGYEEESGRCQTS